MALLFSATLLLSACKEAEPSSPAQLLDAVVKACAAKDVGGILSFVDLIYQDDLGGVGRLEDDLRQLFTVYGPLALRGQDVLIDAKAVRGFSLVEGRSFHFEGPFTWSVAAAPRGPVIRAGLFSDLRNIVRTLRERRQALEMGSADRLEELVSPNYQGKNGGRAELLGGVRNDLAALHGTAIVVEDLKINAGADQAEVIQGCLVITHVGDKALENRIRERLQLRKEGTRWRFAGGLD